LCGYGASPLLYHDRCIINFGPGLRSFVVALWLEAQTLGGFVTNNLASGGVIQPETQRFRVGAHFFRFGYHLQRLDF
jgi:hypothetical protein